MRFFLDTEFTTDDPARLELISIGIVGDDGSRYYAVSDEFDPATCSDFVNEHVLPLLEPRADPVWRSRAAIKDDLVAFLGDRGTEMWGYSPAYDWFLVHELCGGWSKIPEVWPRHCWDLKQWAWQLGVTDLPEQTGRVHHALDDAAHDLVVFEHLASVARARNLPAPSS